MKQKLLQPFIDDHGAVILDGGLATELEKRGVVLDERLWSAAVILANPQTIKDVHRAYLEAGSDCVISSTYQATIEGFISHGLSESEAEEAITRSVTLAIEARDEFVQATDRRPAPLIAASVGPYGAYLADGSEYSGNYGLSVSELVAFHGRRWGLLADSDADLLVCETVPSLAEALALTQLAAESPDIPVWMSFSCRDGESIRDGHSLAECLHAIEDCGNIIAVGVNCCAPRFVTSLISVARAASSKNVLVYPNSGEKYDLFSRSWMGHKSPDELASRSVEWLEAGATIIGGCCRTGPAHIKAVAKAVIQI